MHLNLFVSPRCFLYCNGCYSFSREENPKNIVETPILIKFLKFAYSYGITKVTLCGGDPLTRPDIIKLLEQIKKIGFYVSLDTMGSSIIKDVKLNNKLIIKKIDSQQLSNLVDIIGIPIDGSTSDVFSKFRPTKKNIISEQLSIIEELKTHGAKICINTVVHKGNLNDAKNLANLINKLDYIVKWQIFQFAPLGKFGNLNRNLYEITDQEFLNFKKIVLKKFNDVNKIQFKNLYLRDKIYVIIDNSGRAWLQSFKDSNDREIIGNIKNCNDWNKICSYFIK